MYHKVATYVHEKGEKNARCIQFRIKTCSLVYNKCVCARTRWLTQQWLTINVFIQLKHVGISHQT